MSGNVTWRSGPDIGAVFPSFTLSDQHGNLIDFNSSRAGRRAVVVFYRSADW